MQTDEGMENDLTGLTPKEEMYYRSIDKLESLRERIINSEVDVIEIYESFERDGTQSVKIKFFEKR